MAYLSTTLGTLSAAQKRALLDIHPDEIRKLPAIDRIELAIRHREAFWSAVQAFATGAIPILAFLGFTASVARRGR